MDAERLAAIRTRLDRGCAGHETSDAGGSFTCSCFEDESYDLVAHIDAQAADLIAVRAERDAAEVALVECRVAGNALAVAALRVIRGEGTQQRYEYLMHAMEAWEALVGLAGEGQRCR